MILKSSSTFRSGDEKFSVSRRRDHNSLLSSLCRWCIKAIAQKEFGGYRISYAQQKTTHDVVIGVITRLLFYLVSHHVALEFQTQNMHLPHYGSSVTSCVVLLSLVKIYYCTVGHIPWSFFYYFFFDFSTCIWPYDIMPYAINMHKSTHNIIINIKEFGANVKKTSRLVLNCTSQTI